MSVQATLWALEGAKLELIATGYVLCRTSAASTLGDALGDAAASADRLCELNVLAQAVHVCGTRIAEHAWLHGQALATHGWIYRGTRIALGPGVLRERAGGDRLRAEARDSRARRRGRRTNRCRGWQS